jgi:hypothetical protein
MGQDPGQLEFSVSVIIAGLERLLAGRDETVR